MTNDSLNSKYFSIPLDTSISKDILNIEDKHRSNRFSWTGQFSPEFIEALIINYSNENDVIFDPFSGSGTVLSESIFNNRSAIGIELNPAAFYMSDYYRISVLPLDEKRNIVESLNKLVYENDALSLLKDTFEKSGNLNIRSMIGLIFTLLNLDKKEFSVENLYNIWEDLKFELITINLNGNVQTYLGDARYISLDKNSVDVTITSPPYINVLNYHQQYRKSMECLNWDILQVAKNEVGSNRKNRGNRFYSVEDYVFDMLKIIENTINVTKENGRIIFVVGKESTILGTKFFNGEIIYEIFSSVFKQKMLIKQQRSFKNKFGKEIYEDILHFEVNSSKMPDQDSIFRSTVNLVQNLLIEVIKNTNDDDKIEKIKLAIKRVEKRGKCQK